MKFWFGLITFVLATALYAETQEDAYLRAMKLEEAGDIPAALSAFEDAAAIPGPYTEELQDIIRNYNVALGLSKDGSTNVEKSWEFHVAGELGFLGMFYKETGMEKNEKGGDLFLSVNPYVDYTSGMWSHTFSASILGDYFFNNDEMSVLDTNDWDLVLSLEYTLMRKGLLLDLGYDFNIEGEKLSSDFYLWAEKDLYRFEKQRVGVVAWGYYQTSGPMSYALYGSWHRTVSEGLNGTVYLGAKLEADSVFDYKDYYRQLYETDIPVNEIIFRNSLGKWLGPVLRSRISYKFKNKITLEAKLNLFYGFAVGGPDEDYKKIKKFNGTWGGTVSWKYWKMNYYLGVERNYKRQELPEFYKGLYSESSTFTQIKLGVKWDI